ncbi:MAG TPA: PhoU domain-containing protein [Methanolinea sp.]|nr:PhoU domain-containing protein [Methanolinea sp.]HOS82867.1 PhoU domain-containing protein [Methanolinea sp.]HPC56004.1 PhoU domain-containing protein [Methanolinea sp.]HQE86515.1 PhoU domain-containing protein [Methanolinea sp.]HQI15236.1 PhoU domain-containing protein [Methanolinea sp.]
MEIRKVQVTGGSSYVITLPKEWVQAQKIAKNEPLGMVVQSDGSLLVTKEINEKTISRVRKIDVTAIDDPTYLFRLLIGIYIAGFTTIELFSRTRLPPSIGLIVRDFTQVAIGPEIVEETDNRIVLKDLLNPTEMPFDNTLKRMYVIVKNMYLDAMNAMETRNGKLIEEIISRDSDVDRLHWLIARQSSIVLKNPEVARRMGVSPHMVMNAMIISRIIERIGDHAVRWAENARQIIDHDLDARILKHMKDASTLALSIFDRSITAYYKADIRESHRNIEQVSTLEELCEELNQLVMEEEPDVAVALRYISESIRRSGEYAGDISETVMNYLVEEKI